MAKMCLRFTNFSCSLIVIAMLTTVFTIFNATKSLPKRDKAQAWAPNQKIWPQVTLLSIACVSLAMCIGVFYAYWKGGHRRAEKAAVYYTVFSIAFFFFTIVIWSIGAALLNESKRNDNGQDMWGWACKEGKRKEIFKDDVDYGLLCRLQVIAHFSGILGSTAKKKILALGTRLRLHRNHRRDHYNPHLRHCLLPLLLQKASPQVNGRPRQSPQRSVPGTASHAVRAKYSRLPKDTHGFNFPCQRPR